MAANEDNWHRNLKKSELGGVIIGCTNDTMRESLPSQFFGIPADRVLYVMDLEKGMPIFLFNTDDRKLRGVYEFTGDYKVYGTPDRVHTLGLEICVGQGCPLLTLAEHQFRQIIADNYYSGKDFQFELDHTQVSSLMYLFHTLGLQSLKRYLNRKRKDLKAYTQEYILETGLDKKLDEAGQRINPPSVTLASSWFNLNLDQSIFIVGGRAGSDCLSTLYSFSPSDDKLRSLKSMSNGRIYASVAKIDRELYVLGGHSGSISYNTVEKYNPRNDCWTPLPSLHTPRHFLAAAALNGKLFAIGGRNEDQCLSSVEMFDPSIERWTCACPMLIQRGCLAAVEFDGAIYAVGGSDGNTNFKSAERYDPREDFWSRIGSMGVKRAAHSLVVLNEKLYAIGGFNGSTALPSVEIYDPRLEIWMDGKPMNQGRYGSVAAVVMNESIYVIGGVNSDGQVLDVIECYKEDQGWKETKLSAVGRKCWFSSGTVLAEDDID